jgi:hypothetical protein
MLADQRPTIFAHYYMNLPPVIGITVCNKPYEALAHQAAASFRKYTGAPAIILTTDDPASYDWKYALPEIAGDRVFCFFDADTLVIKPLDLAPFRNIAGVAAVRDASRQALDSFCLPDALALDFPPDRYCNTGFFFANARQPAVRAAFDLARRLMAESRAGIGPVLKDVTEQSLLNAAWYRTGVDMMFLPDGLNFWPHAVHRGWLEWQGGIQVLHAAGVPLAQKAEFLEKHRLVFEP